MFLHDSVERIYALRTFFIALLSAGLPCSQFILPVPTDGLHADGGDDAAEAAKPLAEDDVGAGPARPEGRGQTRGAPADDQHLAPGQHGNLAGFLCKEYFVQ